MNFSWGLPPDRRGDPGRSRGARGTDDPHTGAESALAAPFASFGGNLFYSHPVQRAGICCSRIIRNRPLPDGNKRVGYECMREMLDRSDIAWPRPSEDAEEIALTIEGLAARTVTEAGFISWAQRRSGAR